LAAGGGHGAVGEAAVPVAGAHEGGGLGAGFVGQCPGGRGEQAAVPVGVDAVGELGAGGEQFGEPLVEIGLDDGDQDRLGGAGREVARAAAGTARGERREQRVAQSGVQGGFDRRVGARRNRRWAGLDGGRSRGLGGILSRGVGGSLRRGVGADGCVLGRRCGGGARRRCVLGRGAGLGRGARAVSGSAGEPAAAACSGVRMPAATARSTSSVRIGCQVAPAASSRARSGSIGPCPGRYAGSERSPSRLCASTVICTSGVRRDGGVGSAVQSLRPQVQARWSSPCMSAR